ncbi:MAG: hypothetical protein EOM26_13375 [Alphaproteobacteria bacterium]|nr:hypothetical protein [Alphaproteobacteria bacterium]
MEHLSFRLGNQLFFIRVQDVDEGCEGPGNLPGLAAIAREAQGHACILPMKKKFLGFRGGAWVPVAPGWGLLDAVSRCPVDPDTLITDEKIEVTPWELHDMAVQIVRDYLDELGYELLFWHGTPDTDPSLWFVGETGKPEWVIVRSARFPETRADRPHNWDTLVARCARINQIGHFASVAFASKDQPCDSKSQETVPLHRDHEMVVQFEISQDSFLRTIR